MSDDPVTPSVPSSPSPRALTAADLRAGIILALRARAQGYIHTPVGPRAYDQAVYDCGTACCVHGFAVIHAGLHAEFSCGRQRYLQQPRHIDYMDLGVDENRQSRAWVVKDLLSDPDATPQQISLAAGFVLTEDELRGGLPTVSSV